MLGLLIERFAVCRSAVHGRLWIDGQLVCDTLEYEPSCLEAGSYSLSLERVDSEGRKMMVVGGNSQCMIVARNGPFTLKGGSISVGECHHLGFLIHCEETFERLFLRVRMSLARGGSARLEVRDC